MPAHADDSARDLTRRDFVVRAGLATAGLAAAGIAGAQARAGGSSPSAGEFAADAATAWFDLSLDLVRTTPGYSPPVASRAFAYAGLTLYEALVPGMDGYRSLQGVLGGFGGLPAAGARTSYDWSLVANAALASIFRSLFPTARAEWLAAIDGLERRQLRRFRRSLAPAVRNRSVQHGREVAAAVLEWSKDDGGHEGYRRNFPPYTPPVGPGLWVPTPPGFLRAVQPFWGRNRCFAMRSGAGCPPGDHPPYSEEPGSAFWAEALEVYETVRDLTREQRRIVHFWADEPGVTMTPPGHSISIATQVLRAERSNLATAAETYAKVSMAVSDAFVACWHQKYVYNLLRPVTYLRRLVDPAWRSVIVTPPFPEYPSGHSVQSGAAFQALTDLFGTRYRFVDRSHEERGLPPRRFGSFLEAANEAAFSRMYGGIHYRAAIVNGVAQGRCVASEVGALPFRA